MRHLTQGFILCLAAAFVVHGAQTSMVQASSAKITEKSESSAQTSDASMIPAKQPHTYLVLFGSVRTKRLGMPVAKLVVKTLEKRGHTVHFVDSKDYQFPLLDKLYDDYKQGKAPKKMQAFLTLLEQSDAVVVVSPVYNEGVPPGLKNILDHYKPFHYAKKIAGIVTYSLGRYGGVQIVSNYRKILSELGMTVIPKRFSVPQMHKALDKNGALLEEANLTSWFHSFIDQLEWHTAAFKSWKAIA